ncbi:MAG: NAD(P)H-dependent oxidoreductase [Rhodobacteraceae bacterium]|nr:NAD(P)H-dependent oxidoreductase [Paracoccaceae bacterium]
MPKFLIFAGSARKASTNKQLAALAAGKAKAAGADVTLIDLKDFEMPLYDGDLEAGGGLPENAKRLKQLFVEHDGLFIASPEYNSSISPLLKNALDWISRPHTVDEPPLWAYNGKVMALGSVAPGALGGLRGLVPLRMMLGNIGVTVVPNQVAISNGFSAFDDAGKLTDAGQAQMLAATIDQLIATTNALAASFLATRKDMT